MKKDDNPISPAHRLQNAPRCKAKAKRTGERCRCPAVKGWTVCRVHGAGGGAPEGRSNGNWKHGGRSRAVAELRRIGVELTRRSRLDLGALLTPRGDSLS